MLTVDAIERERRERQKQRMMARIRERQMAGDFVHGTLTVKIPMYVSPWIEDKQHGVRTRFVRAL